MKNSLLISTFHFFHYDLFLIKNKYYYGQNEDEIPRIKNIFFVQNAPFWLGFVAKNGENVSFWCFNLNDCEN